MKTKGGRLIEDTAAVAPDSPQNLLRLTAVKLFIF